MNSHPNNPLVSIIMPTYNRAEYIIQTIASIRRQTYTKWELLVIDDGSDDETEEKLAAEKDKRIMYLKTKHTGIGGRLKNMGLENAKGSLIAFIDSDDLWHPEKLALQVKAMNDYVDTSFSVTGGYNFINHAEPVNYFYEKREGIRRGNLYAAYFQSELAGFTQALMVRKSVALEIGGFVEKKSFSDIDFIVKLAAGYEGIILYNPLLYRRLHEANYIHENWEKSFYEGYQLLKDNRSTLEASVFRKARFRLFMNFGESCLRHRKKTMAMSQFLKGWQSKPFSWVPIRKIVKVFVLGGTTLNSLKDTKGSKRHKVLKEKLKTL